jgi:hypothetical protein
MIRAAVEGRKPDEGTLVVEPDFWLFNCLSANFVTKKDILIHQSTNGACVLPFLGVAQSILVIENYKNIGPTYRAIKTFMTTNSIKGTKVTVSDRSHPGNYHFRLEAKQLNWLNPIDNPHSVKPVAGLRFSEVMGPFLPKMVFREALMPPKTRKWSQRKLLITELQFLNRHGRSSDLVVYAGAAPGTHIAVLAFMFPDHRFELWDSVPFSAALEDIPNVICNKKAFTEKTAATYADKNVLFICDIHKTNGDVEDTVGEMEEQAKLCNAIKPMLASLKFRLERTTDGKRFSYFSGEVQFQPWGSRRSSETRLITNCLNQASYNTTDYDYQMNYFNLVTRNAVFDHIRVPLEGLCHCYDCTSEIRAIQRYLEVYHPIQNNVRGIMWIESVIAETFGWRSLRKC